MFPRLAPSHQPPPAASQRPALPPATRPISGGIDIGASAGVRVRSPVRPSPCLWPPDGAGALGLLPDAPHPAVTGSARQGRDGSANTNPELRCCHHDHPSFQRAHSNRATSCRTKEIKALAAHLQMPGRRREPPPPPPTDLGVNLSIHPARAVQLTLHASSGRVLRTQFLPGGCPCAFRPAGSFLEGIWSLGDPVCLSAEIFLPSRSRSCGLSHAKDRRHDQQAALSH